MAKEYRVRLVVTEVEPYVRGGKEIKDAVLRVGTKEEALAEYAELLSCVRKNPDTLPR